MALLHIPLREGKTEIDGEVGVGLGKTQKLLSNKCKGVGYIIQNYQYVSSIRLDKVSK